MAGRLTTHVLDTARGCPAAGLRVELFRIEAGGGGEAGGEARRHIRSVETDADGRTEGPVLPEEEWEPGTYELVFHAGAYLAGAGTDAPDDAPGGGPRFLDLIPIRFGMAEPAHHHVPLLLAPFGYSTYRGS